MCTTIPPDFAVFEPRIGIYGSKNRYMSPAIQMAMVEAKKIKLMRHASNLMGELK